MEQSNVALCRGGEIFITNRLTTVIDDVISLFSDVLSVQPPLVTWPAPVNTVTVLTG